MPTRIRIDLAGYHHIINRGVNRCNVFNHDNDKDMFLQIINKASKTHDIVLHDYVLMDNHYHLLVETKKENLPMFMRIINANYAKYYNKKYNRSGHLWQDRYKSRYIIHDEYFYIVLKYIEYNPVEAKMTSEIGKYKFTLAYNILHSKKYKECCKESILIKGFNPKELIEFLDISITEDELKILNEKTKIDVKRIEEKIVIKEIKELYIYFENINTKEKRNKAILEAYYDGHTQVKISEYLAVSKSFISKILKSGDSFSGV